MRLAGCEESLKSDGHSQSQITLVLHRTEAVRLMSLALRFKLLGIKFFYQKRLSIGLLSLQLNNLRNTKRI